MIDPAALRKVFNPKVVAETLATLSPAPSVLTQVVFADKRTHPAPVIGIDEIEEFTGTAPLVRYGESPVELDAGTRTVTLVEPEPITLKKTIRPREIALLSAMTGQNLKEYARDKIASFKRVIEVTTRALCGQALAGKLQHPLKTDVGQDVYEFAYGAPAVYTPSTTWDQSTAKPLNDLDKMLTKLQKKNIGGPYAVLAGEDAYRALISYLENKQGVIVANYTKIDEQSKLPYVEYFGFRIYKVAETYTAPNGTVKPVIDPKSVYLVGELPWSLKFLALDDIEYGPVALPMLVKTVKDQYGKSLSIVAESKPFPLPRVRATVKAKVLP